MVGASPVPVMPEVVEVLAVADRLAASVLEAMAGVDAVAEAEQAGVIVVHDDEGLECRLAHRLKDLAPWERIKKYVIAEAFSVAREQLTVSLKLRRAVILEHYRAEVEQLYQG